MNLQIIENAPNHRETLEAYGTIPIAFMVTTRFIVQPIENGLGGLRLVEEPVVPPYLKDYDAFSEEGPLSWPVHFNLSHWRLLTAFVDSQRVGGVALAWNTPGIDMLEGRDDLAVLWDLRVHPKYRGHGMGQALFAIALDWARKRGCRELKVETQNINVPACRFYARQGCELRSIVQNAYPDLLEEVQLLWYRML